MIDNVLLKYENYSTNSKHFFSFYFREYKRKFQIQNYLRLDYHYRLFSSLLLIYLVILNYLPDVKQLWEGLVFHFYEEVFI